MGVPSCACIPPDGDDWTERWSRECDHHRNQREALRVAREALKQYAHHKPHCLSLSAYYIEAAYCTCGLGEALHKIKELMEEKGI